MDRVTLRWGRGVEEPVLSVAEGTPAMPVGRCSWELSGRKLHRKIKKSQTLRMTILWEFDEKHLRQVSAYGTQFWSQFNRPHGTHFASGT